MTKDPFKKERQMPFSTDLFVRFITIITSLVFISSGLIKLNDPIGTEIKLEEYFEVFKTDASLGLSYLKTFWEILTPYSLSLGIFLSVAEVSLGFSLLIFYRLKNTLWTLLFLLIFFGFLTFYSAYFNKVTDCGCFGDALKLTPWQSFSKDITLFLMVLYLMVQSYIWKNSMIERGGIMWSLLTFTVTLLSLGLAYYSINYAPYIDFRPYKIGATIPAQMKPRHELKYEDKYTFLNKKTNKEEQFDKWQSDTLTYKYVKFDKKLLNPQDQAKITDYKIFDEKGTDFTTMSFKGRKLIVIIEDVKKANTYSFNKINSLVYMAQQNLSKDSVQTFALTASDKASFKSFAGLVQFDTPFYFCDRNVLKTILRSNPGIWLLENGKVKGKWQYQLCPDYTAVLKTLNE